MYSQIVKSDLDIFSIPLTYQAIDHRRPRNLSRSTYLLKRFLNAKINCRRKVELFIFSDEANDFSGIQVINPLEREAKFCKTKIAILLVAVSASYRFRFYMAVQFYFGLSDLIRREFRL